MEADKDKLLYTDEYVSYRIGVPAEFETVFSHFYFAANNSQDAITKRLLPSYQTIFIISFKEPVTLHTDQDIATVVEKCLVLGPVKRAFEYTLPAGAEMLVASFNGDAFQRFFSEVLFSSQCMINPDELVEGGCFDALWHSLKQLNSAEERVDYLLNFCRPYLKEGNAISKQLAEFANNDMDPVKTLADETGQSQRNIQLLHKKHLGYSAKEYHRYRRFMKALALTQSLSAGQQKVDWFEIIEQCGYYDQSRLIHDFQYFIGITPTQFLKLQESICSAAPDK